MLVHPGHRLLSRRFRRWWGLATAVTLSAAVLVPADLAQAAPTDGSEATGGPGVVSHNGQARKDCVGTARTTTSKIWFTVADGVLSDVYAPTVDTTNVQSMQYLVTDGSSFTDLQTRDMTYTSVGDRTGMMCTVTATAKSGRYKLITTYLTDRARDSVVAHTRYLPLTTAARGYRLYVRLDASVGGDGGGGTTNSGADTATVDTSTGSPVPVSFDTANDSGHAYAVPSYVAMRASGGFSSVSSGFVGADSDGLNELDATHALTPEYTTATGGNVEQTAGVRPDSHGAFTLSLGFATTQAGAVHTAGATLATSLTSLERGYRRGWRRYDRMLRRPSFTLSGLTTAQRLTAAKDYYQSANVVKASEDKTFPGAIVAGLDAPWGQSVTGFNTGYREVFARDLYEAWTALYTDGDLSTARATVRYLLLKSQQADGSEPRNSTLDGAKAPDAFNIQLDESSYPILMALQSGLGHDTTLWPHIKLMANWLISHGPSYGAERWEEQTGYSPSTISAEIAGLVSAATIARMHHDAADARVWAATADYYQRNITTWGVTSTGSLSTAPYFIRLSKTGDPNAAISYGLGNGGATVDQRDVVDLGFLEYVRLGEMSPTDPILANSLAVVDGTLERQTANGPGWLRYNGDGYGDCYVPAATTSCTTTGAPWTDGDVGTGHPWPVLGAERAQQDMASGDITAATAELATINRENSGPGLVPEQVWDYPDLPPSPDGSDPATASIGFVNGQADGSASPLTWASGAQVRLTADLSAGRDLEQPAQVRRRYVTHTQASTPLTVTSPTDQSAVDTTVAVTGTGAPGARIDIADVDTDNNTATTHTATKVKRDGTFTVDVTAAAGTNVLVITATVPTGGTAEVVRTVVSDIIDGTLIYSADDPTGDDGGPGDYAYPTASDFHPGAFDLTRFQAYDTGSTITFRVQTADLTSTFGSTDGAQLVDLYVHDPNATTTSTDASYPGMNYTIDPAAAWSRLIEVQGFGNSKFVDPTGAPVGTVDTSANSITRDITFSVDKTALGGTPTTGWGFTVTLTGQDGTHGVDQTRAFTSTPSGYTFGVCATDDGSALCTADPTTVPKVMDTITPTGITQPGELDYTHTSPVELHDITIP